MNVILERTIFQPDDNIEQLRNRYSNGMHFIVGDLHGEVTALKNLMDKIHFDPNLDRVYFVGDYNAGGDVRKLLGYMAQYYKEDHEAPGFHMIRGNHERELGPLYPLDNLPDVIVIRGTNLNFFITHAGMVLSAFDLINSDMDNDPHKHIFAYRLEDNTCCYDAPLRQLVWSLRGLYSQHSRWRVWPTEDKLVEKKACIIHGHTPYCYFKKPDRYTYGDDNLFWADQHVWFCRELQSFNLDSNIKGRYENGESYRGLACLCMEVYDELASGENGMLTTEALLKAENGIFGVKLNYSDRYDTYENPDAILNANPEAKTIALDDHGRPYIV